MWVKHTNHAISPDSGLYIQIELMLTFHGLLYCIVMVILILWMLHSATVLCTYLWVCKRSWPPDTCEFQHRDHRRRCWWQVRCRRNGPDNEPSPHPWSWSSCSQSQSRRCGCSRPRPVGRRWPRRCRPSPRTRSLGEEFSPRRLAPLLQRTCYRKSRIRETPQPMKNYGYHCTPPLHSSIALDFPMHHHP